MWPENNTESSSWTYQHYISMPRQGPTCSIDFLHELLRVSTCSAMTHQTGRGAEGYIHPFIHSLLVSCQYLVTTSQVSGSEPETADTKLVLREWTHVRGIPHTEAHAQGIVRREHREERRWCWHLTSSWCLCFGKAAQGCLWKRVIRRGSDGCSRML